MISFAFSLSLSLTPFNFSTFLGVSFFTRFSYARVNDILYRCVYSCIWSGKIWSMQRFCDKLDQIQENDSIRWTEPKCENIQDLICLPDHIISTTLVGWWKSGNTHRHTALRFHINVFRILCIFNEQTELTRRIHPGVQHKWLMQMNKMFTLKKFFKKILWKRL